MLSASEVRTKGQMIYELVHAWTDREEKDKIRDYVEEWTKPVELKGITPSRIRSPRKESTQPR